MRDNIKFRAYDKERKEYLSVGHIFLQINAGRNPADCVQYLDLLNNPNAYANRFVIEQFTGLYDKAKKPIYEGDILLCPSVPNIPLEVRYNVSQGAFCLVEHTHTEGALLGTCPIGEKLRHYPDMRVIGSIPDTPELLNEKEI